MGDEGLSGRPAYRFRYKHFLMACAAVSAEQVHKESAMALGGTTSEGGPQHGKGGRKKRKRR